MHTQLVHRHPTAGFSLTRLVAHVAGWLRNRAERRSLLQLDDRTLDDLGLTRGDVERELLRPFWQPIDHEALDEARHHSGPRLRG